MFGELSGKIRSTPTPYEILRTVNVDREPFETRRMHTPSKAWRRVFSPSRIFAHTLIESPGRNSGSATCRCWDLLMVSRMRLALMFIIRQKTRWDAGFCQRTPLHVKDGARTVGRAGSQRPIGPTDGSSPNDPRSAQAAELPRESGGR